ncbi:SRPBCC family protein [Streptomyces sp. NPDC098789]|uniref:SRPBCC family protein n=1 Tax=Streptomyces sp. NPDC098789 TaxID=3366098 RepID=UPI00382AF399
MTTGWPTTELDPVQRLRVMAAGLGAVMYVEEYVAAPPDVVWDVAGDLEGELPHLVPTLREFRMAGGPGQVQGWAHGPLGYRARFDVLLQPGYCLMQSRRVIGGMAAVAEGEGTRFAVLGGVRGGGYEARALRALCALGDDRGRRMIARARRRIDARNGAGPQGA